MPKRQSPYSFLSGFCEDLVKHLRLARYKLVTERKNMGVEAGPSGAVGLAGTVPVAVGEFSTIVKEGPVSRGALENTMTIAKFNPIGEIVFKPSVPSVLEQAQAIAAAAWEKSELTPQVPQEVLLPVVLPRAEPLVAPRVEPAPALQTSPAPKTEARVSHQVSRVVSPQPLLKEKEMEEVVEEKIRVDEPKESLDEQEEIIKKERFYLVDEPVLVQVQSEVDQAVEKGKEEAENLGLGKRIIGFIVAKFIPAQHEGNTGGAVKPHGFDGTIPARKEAIAARKEFSSKKEVEAVVLENRPVSIGENGELASPQEIRTTFRDRYVKPHEALNIVERRITRKKKVLGFLGQAPISVIAKEEIKPKPETSLEDYPELAEIFQQVA